MRWKRVPIAAEDGRRIGSARVGLDGEGVVIDHGVITDPVVAAALADAPAGANAEAWRAFVNNPETRWRRFLNTGRWEPSQ